MVDNWSWGDWVSPPLGKALIATSLAVTIHGSLIACANAADWPDGAIVFDRVPFPWSSNPWDADRMRLKRSGIDLQLKYISELAGNATGGLRRQVAYADQWSAGVTLDLGKLGAVSGGTVQITVTDRHGSSLSDDAKLGTLQPVQEIFGRGQTTRLTQFWYNQKFAGEQAEWKIGRMSFGEEFSSFTCDFQNLTFCGAQAGNVAGTYIYNTPISQWATRLRINLGSTSYLKFGAFDQNPKYLGLQNALLPVFFPGSTGVLLPLELAWNPSIEGLPGSYKVGGWYDTSPSDVVVGVIENTALNTAHSPTFGRRGRRGAYVNFIQQITGVSAGEARRGTSLFFNATVTDGRTTLTDKQISAGLLYMGPFQSRPLDDIGFAVGATRFNSNLAWSEIFRSNAVANAAAMRGSEYVMEAYYTYRPMAGLEIRPNVQFVVRPGGSSENRNALVFGLKTLGSF